MLYNAVPDPSIRLWSPQTSMITSIVIVDINGIPWDRCFLSYHHWSMWTQSLLNGSYGITHGVSGSDITSETTVEVHVVR